MSNASGDRTAERHAAAVASTFATCYTTGIAHGALRRAWEPRQQEGRLALWREVGALAGSREPLGVKPVAAHSNSNSSSASNSD